MEKLDIFIEGETIDLCIPTLEFIEKGNSYQWWNNPIITRFLDSGSMPNTIEKQKKFYEENLEQKLLLFVQNKNSNIIGNIAIVDIDYKKRTGAIGLTFANFFRTNPLEALEAVARITEHAFLKLGLKRIYTRQHIKLTPWSHRMSLVGYRLEGIFKNDFVKGVEITNTYQIAAHYEDYQTIISHRGGGLWDSQKNMLQRIRSLPKTPIHKKLQEFFKEHQEYYMDIFTL